MGVCDSTREMPCSLLAKLLAYPEPGYAERVGECLRGLEGGCPEAGELIGEFVERTAGQSVEAMQELYTATFDMNPKCSLEVGWHLFGENYERGAFLVRMRELLGWYGIAESAELPDHLTHVLAVLDHMEPHEAAGMIRDQVVPAVDRMLAGFEGSENPYVLVMRAIRQVLEYESQADGPSGRSTLTPALSLEGRGGLAPLPLRERVGEGKGLQACRSHATQLSAVCHGSASRGLTVGGPTADTWVAHAESGGDAASTDEV